MGDYLTPGVYVEEKGALTLGIQAGETAVPVFVGHFDPVAGGVVPPPVRCVRVDSWLDFSLQFRTDASESFHIDLKNKDSPELHGTYLGSYSVRLFLENGGGRCYVLPLNEFSDQRIAEIGPAVEQCPDITLLCWCEHRSAEDERKILAALGQLTGAGSRGMQGRFLLADATRRGSDIEVSPVSDHRHAAAYFPALRTTYRFAESTDRVQVKNCTVAGKPLGTIGAIRECCEGNYSMLTAAADKVAAAASSVENQLQGAGEVGLLHSCLASLAKLKNISFLRSGDDAVKEPCQALLKIIGNVSDEKRAQFGLAFLEGVLNEYVDCKTAIDKCPDIRSVIRAAEQPVILRASVAIAGVYARTDRERGVWKAPANVELSGVAGLVSVNPDTGRIDEIRVDDALNDQLIKGGVNAVRFFSGRGYVVWGARTLVNSAETAWRYIPVRRLFDAVERDVQDAMRVAVFEPNNQPTWTSVRTVVGQYLYRLWERGALMGATPEQAYFVRVGLAETMTAEDIESGRLIVKIGLAAVRPAEYIILQLTQDMVAI
ncbi:phage tail sheath family protein [Burkholderia ambifaria]|uniref:Phage tail sheath protein FI-like protein n=1 Tax=Burkholderia ambifaria MEX-5 TaxID=396597 RepID=B1T4F5_9BURK|nr:phage tail sheath C-terminal domain-containing protein [Burkholderia ambifaria]EDT41553.1 Phage tail sheath protein FI-like protein [Burkholderia ambifaria MEX-5]